MEPALAIQEFLEYVVNGLVEYPEDATVEREERDGVHLYLIRLHPEDSGRIIGRSGKTIQAIRGLVLASAEKHRVRADVEVVRELRE
jgi:predicted RNA-binding protein YlqC (UPF0109 family)